MTVQYITMTPCPEEKMWKRAKLLDKSKWRKEIIRLPKTKLKQSLKLKKVETIERNILSEEIQKAPSSLFAYIKKHGDRSHHCNLDHYYILFNINIL